MLRRALVGFSPRTLILIIKQEIVDEQAEARNILPYQRQREAKEHIVNRMENRCSSSSKILLSSISGGGGAQPQKDLMLCERKGKSVKHSDTIPPAPPGVL